MRLFSILLLCFISWGSWAQPEQKLVRQGNNLYARQHYEQAQEKYDQALSENSNYLQGIFNRGDVLYKQGNFKGAAEAFQLAAKLSANNNDQVQALHNLGNSYIQQKKYQDAINAYKKALLLDPSNKNTRYNLSYAMKMMKEQKKNQNKDKNKDQQQNEQQKQKQQQNKDQQQNEQQKQDQQQKDQNQQQNQQLNKQQAEQLLKALQAEEDKTLKDKKKREAKPISNTHNVKDW